ncbi:protein PsiE [Cytobacillus horneckiae]|uniref:Protein PsiE n=1 Tax=Cytobacillus horneckiae TaxID=549687 RepID=A0A2N0ZL11_9BACI|nr:phosphate-starvation-inducible PsiE family protein [Cytobacillus horneckiae]MBN6885630.1 phosphate-starvation-inducible PsiE family protein [Cytobacillus horneckiae]MEC1156259.1 phosphate-starvation-inducible PsiE family protein [Cytobacillus horneckiae]MED2938277.1 phosphate-starvation-inducible PsiE family protein [Cytobacillus horneckiae]PKG30205.1 phosphate-starvation-inducible protein PsiE [Cytobacillus horneckiae]
MSAIYKLKKGKWVLKFYQNILNLSLIILSCVLIFFLFRELFNIVKDAFIGNNDVHDILGRVLVFFLYFGFITMIVDYFKENYHFPIKNLLYIGITATIRFIIVNNEHPIQNLWLSLVVLVLMISYFLPNKRLEV